MVVRSQLDSRKGTADPCNTRRSDGHDREMWEERRRRKWEDSELYEVFISSPEKAAGGASLVMVAHLDCPKPHWMNWSSLHSCSVGLFLGKDVWN